MSNDRIPLRGRDGSIRAYALVDPSDHDRLVEAGSWHLMGSGYAERSARCDGRSVHCHHFGLFDDEQSAAAAIAAFWADRGHPLIDRGEAIGA